MTEVPVLLDVVRGGRVESRHRGAVVLLGPGGAVETAAGEIDAPVFARSSFKPMQASTLVRAGWQGSREAVALAAASHNGEGVHRDGVRRTLAAARLGEDALGCPADLPGERNALIDYVAGGGQPAPLCHNCSGKHAAMVATCVAAGWDVGGYLAPDHPLQRAVVAEIERLCGAPIAASSVDGCGAPAHAVPLVALARGFAALAVAAPDTPEATVVAAVRAHPQLVGGTGRAVSELLAEVDGLLAKDGAEGVWAAALPDGRAFAAKVEDGAARALPPLLAAALRYWGFDGPAVRRWSAVDVTGGGGVVGSVRPSAELTALLGLD
ncbi:asparaginase [Jatrophihabitans endophyticus]|uniref:Asparaginase n=1 Tax=Jatrophihabitans endophyticus TaxID=1206085 RepID=A0A1M5GRB1_9ACTN|nr:asparaginase [Jatrophihabitans endophyticus]SHG06178.1 asparaginase [Jatrophihabitans endophyticus]